MSTGGSPTEDAPKQIRPGEELDVAALTAYLARELGPGDVRVEQFPGGHSNLTYLVHHGDQELVLRRPPFGSKVKSAHDMGREYTVLSKLSAVYPRAPRPYAYEPTGDVLGAPFYLMERRRGVILRKEVPAAIAGDLPRVRQVCEHLVDALVELHAVDYTAAGLGEFGKPAGYIERQVTGWTKRYTDSQTDDLPALTESATWLAAHLPAEVAPALIHNDFKFDNVIFDAELSHITGVLDWEMATVGDPLMDLGTALSYWAEATDPQAFYQLPFGPTMKPGMMTRNEFAERYLERSGLRTDHLVFYYAFGLIKTAVVLQQIYYRWKQGITQDARFGHLIMGVRILSEQARTAIHRGSI
ncbi:MAG TPA: phosphotransferase family protein [Kofleriaceae bacterium]|jgi:aminoglycoside phosphotransferase (APT) family kinase protein|nr:phosphotransferase family protein [Kofleriaceae bacterium]